MVPVWFTQFFFITSGVILVMLINEDKLIKLEEKLSKNKNERKKRK
jgi:hypothetical protein